MQIYVKTLNRAFVNPWKLNTWYDDKDFMTMLSIVGYVTQLLSLAPFEERSSLHFFPTKVAERATRYLLRNSTRGVQWLRNVPHNLISPSVYKMHPLENYLRLQKILMKCAFLLTAHKLSFFSFSLSKVRRKCTAQVCTALCGVQPQTRSLQGEQTWIKHNAKCIQENHVYLILHVLARIV